MKEIESINVARKKAIKGGVSLEESMQKWLSMGNVKQIKKQKNEGGITAC